MQIPSGSVLSGPSAHFALRTAPKASVTVGPSVGKPAVSGATTGYRSFNLLSVRSFLFDCKLKSYGSGFMKSYSASVPDTDSAS